MPAARQLIDAGIVVAELLQNGPGVPRSLAAPRRAPDRDSRHEFGGAGVLVEEGWLTVVSQPDLVGDAAGIEHARPPALRWHGATSRIRPRRR